MNRLEYMEQRVREHPEDTFARYALGMEYAGAGRLEDASRVYGELRRDAPGYLPTYYQLGKALEQLGRAGEARDAYTQGIGVARAAGNQKTANELTEALENTGP
ncbi:MAG: hypothetical protein HY303_20210 [Candidatus Wallbacteria bacterium]|nr:hypothetical protein [Candidatus Wallbacteria bacterium]